MFLARAAAAAATGLAGSDVEDDSLINISPGFLASPPGCGPLAAAAPTRGSEASDPVADDAAPIPRLRAVRVSLSKAWNQAQATDGFLASMDLDGAVGLHSEPSLDSEHSVADILSTNTLSSFSGLSSGIYDSMGSGYCRSRSGTLVSVPGAMEGMAVRYREAEEQAGAGGAGLMHAKGGCTPVAEGKGGGRSGGGSMLKPTPALRGPGWAAGGAALRGAGEGEKGAVPAVASGGFRLVLLWLVLPLLLLLLPPFLAVFMQARARVVGMGAGAQAQGVAPAEL